MTTRLQDPPNLRQALELESFGFWVVPIYQPGESLKSKNEPAKGKEPWGKSWGLERRDKEWLIDHFRRFSDHGIGICFGPGRAPGGRWRIDLEGDGERAAKSLAIVLGSDQEPLTPSWDSRRGGHTTFVLDETDGLRLLDLLGRAGATECKEPGKAGVWHVDALPDLEWRIGGYKPDGTVKQVQSVVPPTKGEDGVPRVWKTSPDTPVAELPASAFEVLEALTEMALERKATASNDAPSMNGIGNGHDPFISVMQGKYGDVGKRAIAYLATCEPAVSGQRGHDKTFGVACRVGPGFDLGEESTVRILLAHYNPRCVPEWTEAEIRHKVSDAFAEEKRRGWLLEDLRRQSSGAAKPPDELNKKLTKRPRTDLGNGERLVARFGASIHYCHPWKKWLHFDGRRWKEDDTAAVHRIAKRAVRGILKEAATIGDDDERKAHNGWWRASEGKARVEAMLSLASSENGIPILPDQMDRDRFLLNVLNGTIDLKTGKLRPHQREDLITRLAPVKFLPDAKCSTWLRVLSEIFGGDHDLVRFWKMLCGICLTGDVSNQILPVLYGPGANGKTTILTALLEILGPDYAITAPPGLLTLKKGERHPTELASLFNKRLVVDSETAEGAQFNENLVKQLTGSDRIRARRMREDFWEFGPTHKILMCTNHKPEIRETKNAIWRRVKLVPFNVTIADDKQDARLPDRLRSEYPGILAWCVQGCLEWQELGLEIPTAVEDATQEYRRESDAIGEFLAAECTIGNGLSGQPLKARATPLYARYQKWAGADAVNQRKFGKAMTERGFAKSKSGVFEYEGLGLRPEDADA